MIVLLALHSRYSMGKRQWSAIVGSAVYFTELLSQVYPSLTLELLTQATRRRIDIFRTFFLHESEISYKMQMFCLSKISHLTVLRRRPHF